MLLVDELREAWRAEPRDHRLALLAIIAIGIALRLAHLGQPIRYDEAVTYLYFVRQPWGDALSLYTYPNNHLFHTLLAKASISVFGDSPSALRLPALLAGTLVVPATYALARESYGGRAALFAAAIVASSGTLTLYSTNARGYTLVVLGFLLLWLAGARLLRRATAAPWPAFIIVAALGLWAIPVMLYPLGAVAVWLGLSLLVEDRGDDLRRLGVALLVAFGLALVAYAPVIAREGLAALTRNRFVVATGWYEFFEQLAPTVREALVSWGLGVPPVVSLGLAACAVYALRHHASLSRFRVSFAVAAYAWSAWLLVVNHRAPFPRVWLWALPLVAALAAAGIDAVMAPRRKPERVADWRQSAIAVAFALGAALSVRFSGAVFRTRDTGTFPDAANAAAAVAKALRPGDRVLAAIPTNAPLSYHLARLGVPDSVLTTDERSAPNVFAIVDRSEGQTLEGIAGGSAVRDTASFAPPVLVTTLPRSFIVLFRRRNAAAK